LGFAERQHVFDSGLLHPVQQFFQHREIRPRRFAELVAGQVPAQHREPGGHGGSPVFVLPDLRAQQGRGVLQQGFEEEGVVVQQFAVVVVAAVAGVGIDLAQPYAERVGQHAEQFGYLFVVRHAAVADGSGQFFQRAQGRRVHGFQGKNHFVEEGRMIHAARSLSWRPVEWQAIVGVFRAGPHVQVPLHGIVFTRRAIEADTAVVAEFMYFFRQFLRVGHYLGEGFLQRAAQREVLVKLCGHPVRFVVAHRPAGGEYERYACPVKKLHLPPCRAAVEKHQFDGTLAAQFFGQGGGLGIRIGKPQSAAARVAGVVNDLDLAVGHHQFFDKIGRGAFRQQRHVVSFAMGAVECALDFFAFGGELV
jgi:hypothetical protein